MYIHDRQVSGSPYRRNELTIILRPSERYYYPDLLSGLGQATENVDDFLNTVREKITTCSWLEFLPILLGKQPKKICVFILAMTRSGNRVEAFFFPGTSQERALVISGVHGSELSGIEVAQRLVKRLFEDANKGIKPHFNVIVVPMLFPENAETGRSAHEIAGDDNNAGRLTATMLCAKRVQTSGKEECVDPNRQFPTPGKPFNPADPVDALGTKLEEENVKLVSLINSFKPSRIASVHAHKMPGTMKPNIAAPGIFADPHTVGPNATPTQVNEALERTKADCELAKRIAARFLAEYKILTKGDGKDRIPGNWVNKLGNPTVCEYGSKAFHQCGVSLGGWGPRSILGVRDSIMIITVEVRHYYSSSVTGKPKGTESRRGVTNRPNELQAHCIALREIFLELP